MGLGGVRRGTSPDGIQERRQGQKDRELQAGRNAQRPLPRPHPPIGHAAPRRPFSLLDADPVFESDVVQGSRRHGGAPAPANTRGLSPHQGRRLPPGWLDALCPAMGPHRIVCDVGAPSESSITPSRFISWTDSPWRSSGGTRGGHWVS